MLRCALLCHAKEQQAMGDGRLIALSMGNGAVISAARPDSISYVSVSPLMFSSPFLSSLLISSSPSYANPRCTFRSSCPLASSSVLSRLILMCPSAFKLIPWKLQKPTMNSLTDSPASQKPRCCVEPLLLSKIFFFFKKSTSVSLVSLLRTQEK